MRNGKAMLRSQNYCAATRRDAPLDWRLDAFQRLEALSEPGEALALG